MKSCSVLSHFPNELPNSETILMPVMVDMKKIEEGRRKTRAKASQKNEQKDVSVVPLQTAPEEDISKMSPAAEERCKQFELSYGKEALNNLEALHERHEMVNPLTHPKEPYVKCWEEMWSPFEYSRDAQGEAMLKALAEDLKAKNAMFEDPMFPAENSSLFADPADAAANLNAQQTFRKDQDAFLAGVTGIEWKRPKEWGNPQDKIAIFSGGIDPDDVAQGRLGNCYYLAAIASCAQGHDDVLLKDLCIEDFADLGMYGVKFFLNGKWVTVVVDDRIPCVKAGNSWAPIFSSPKLHSGQEKSVKELWPMIFEKAWAKLHLSYEATAGGLTEDASSYLTGGLLRNIELQDCNSSDNAHAWRECMKALHPAEGTATAFCSCAVRDGEDPSKQGLITGHAYSILKMVQSDGTKLVQVRNPWGEHEWKGDYSDNSSLWTAKLKEDAGWEAEEDGAFFMSWADFTRYFGAVEVCDPTVLSSFTEGNMCRYDIFASHWVAGMTAGGPPPSGKLDGSLFQFNPTAKMSVTADGPVAVTLFLPDTRCMELTYEKKYSLNIREEACHMSSVYITDVTAGSPPKMIVECTPWARQASEISELKKGHVYHITAGTFAPGQEGAFWIAVAGHGLFIEPLPFKYLTMPSDSPLVQEMQANYDPYPCCGKCHNEIKGSYFKTALGPQCPECNKGTPPPRKTRDPPPGTLALSDTTKDFVQVEKGEEVENVKAVEEVTPISVQAEEGFPYVLVWATLGALLAILLSIWHRD